MHTNNSFIQGQENMKFLVKANSNKEYNDYLFNQVNIKDVKLVSLLNILLYNNMVVQVGEAAAPCTHNPLQWG